ncbi:MAG: hypothetical protein ACNA8P_02080 [Phycisphaerales bacterium]
MAFSAEIIILIVTVGLFAAVFACASRLAAPVFFCMLLFASSISSPVEAGFYRPLTWIGPIQTYRNYLFVAAGFLLLLNLFVQGRHYRPFGAPVNVYCMIGVGLWMGLMIAVQGDPIQGILTAVAAAISLGGVAMLLNQTRDYRASMWLFVGSIFAVTCLINLVIIGQFAINPRVLLSSEWSRRFQGLTGNPQFLGAQLAMIITVCLWMLLNKTKRWVLFALIPILGLNSLFLLWTGSRTAIGMCVIGVSIVLFSRFKQAALGLPVAAAAVAVAYKLVGSLLTDVDTSRIASLENTRRGAWTRLLEIYAQNPLIGAGLEDGAVDKSENSFLYGLAAYGTGMGLLYALAIITTGTLVLRMLMVRRKADIQLKGMIDLVIALNATFFAGTILEGYFIGRVNVLIILFVGINAVGYQIVRQLAAVQSYTVPLADEQDEYQPDTVQSETGPQNKPERGDRPNYAELAF